MNQEQKKLRKWIHALRVSKKFMAKSKNHSSGVCVALMHAYNENLISNKTYCDLCDHIAVLIGPNVFVTDWLFNNSAEYVADHNKDMSYLQWLEKLIAYRLAWMDHMIQYFQSLIDQPVGESK